MRERFPVLVEKVQSFKERVTDLVWEVDDSAKLGEKILITSHLKFPNMFNSDLIAYHAYCLWAVMIWALTNPPHPGQLLRCYPIRRGYFPSLSSCSALWDAVGGWVGSSAEGREVSFRVRERKLTGCFFYWSAQLLIKPRSLSVSLWANPLFPASCR